jgi:hypothetical protein
LRARFAPAGASKLRRNGANMAEVALPRNGIAGFLELFKKTAGSALSAIPPIPHRHTRHETGHDESRI